MNHGLQGAMKLGAEAAPEVYWLLTQLFRIFACV